MVVKDPEEAFKEAELGIAKGPATSDSGKYLGSHRSVSGTAESILTAFERFGHGVMHS